MLLKIIGWYVASQWRLLFYLNILSMPNMILKRIHRAMKCGDLILTLKLHLKSTINHYSLFQDKFVKLYHYCSWKCFSHLLLVWSWFICISFTQNYCSGLKAMFYYQDNWCSELVEKDSKIDICDNENSIWEDGEWK